MRFLSAAAAGILVLLLSAQVSLAEDTVTKQVDCSNPNKSITAAVSNLDNDKEYVIEVSGTCTENVLIANYQGPSLQIVGTPSATLAGVDSTPLSSPLTITGSRRVTLSNFTVNPTAAPPGNPDGNINGISMTLCAGCGLNNVIVNSTRLGLLISQSQGFFVNLTVNVASVGQALAVIQSSDLNLQNFEATGSPAPPMSFSALSVQGGSRVRLFYTTPKTIKNFQTAILVANAGSLEGPGACGTPPFLSACLTIQDSGTGLRVTGAQVFQMGGVVFNNNGDGIFAESESVVQLLPPITITNSTGAGGAFGNGITATHNSHVSVSSFGTAGGLPPNVISANFNRGIAVASSSTLQLNGPDADNANQITGNGTAVPLRDIACDLTSLVTGTNTTPPGTIISCVNSNPTSIPLP